MRVAVLYSGGKDSNLSAYRVFAMGHELACLISVIPDRGDSYMFHVPNVWLARVQAECMGLPWEAVRVSGEKEREVSELAEALPLLKEKHSFDALSTGAIASRYQKARVESACAGAGIAHLSPLWQQDEESLLREMVRLGFEVYFTSVSAEGLTPGWLGRRLDLDAISDLLRLRERHGINLSGEGGEYETFVADMPLFRKRIRILSTERVLERTSGVMVITGYDLVEKPAAQE